MAHVFYSLSGEGRGHAYDLLAPRYRGPWIPSSVAGNERALQALAPYLSS